ncbi:MAG TPA: hypothetical protein PKC73_13225, partial [Dermatophilaceae bacterium]|nr:hypothetical protein [Dermatophilaceae bacterium]
MTNAQQSPLPAVPKMVGQALKAWEAPLPVTLPSDGDHWIDLPASSDQVFKTWARIEGMQPKGIGRPKDFATGLKMFTRDISQTKWGDAEFVYLDSFMRVPVEADVHTHIVVDQVRLVLSYYTTPIIRFAFSFYPAILSTKPEGLHKDGSSLFRDKSRRSLTRMREVLSSSDELNLLQSKRRAEEVASAARDVLVRAQGLGIDALDSDLRSVAKMLVTKGSIRLVSAIEEYVHLIDSDDPPRVKGQTAAELEHTLLLLREWLEGNSLDLIPAGPALDTLIKELRRRLDVLSFKVPSMYACSCGLNQFINSRAARTSLDALAK